MEIKQKQRIGWDKLPFISIDAHKGSTQPEQTLTHRNTTKCHKCGGLASESA